MSRGDLYWVAGLTCLSPHVGSWGVGFGIDFLLMAVLWLWSNK